MKIAFTAALLLSSTSMASEIFEKLPKSCVAWKVRKRMFLVSQVHPLGKSCALNIRRESTAEGSFRIHIETPADSFQSGEAERDLAVAEILGGKNKEPIVVLSKKFETEQALTAFLNDPPKSENIFLRLQGKEHSIEAIFDRSSENEFLVGTSKTSFKDLGLEAPTVGGGAVAKVAQEIELHFRIKKGDLK